MLIFQELEILEKYYYSIIGLFQFKNVFAN